MHRTILVVDVERFGDRRRTNQHQLSVRAGMYDVLRQAFDEAGIPWSKCDKEDRGDGVFVLIPADVPKALCSELLPLMLVNALRTHNSTSSDESRIRLRMALHAGEVNYDDHGVTAASVNLAFRLLDAGALKAALAESAGVLAIIASDWFYDEVIRHSPASNPSSFRPVEITVKETSGRAWIALPDCPYSPREQEPATTGKMPMNQFFAVVEALESIPCLRSEDSRAQVVEQLRPAISGAVRHYPQRRAHVMSIVRTCLDYDGGLAELLTLITFIEQDGSTAVRRLFELLGQDVTRGIAR